MADPTIQITGPAVIPDTEGDGFTTSAAKVRQDSISGLSTTDIFQFIKSLALVAVSLNDTFTTVVPNATVYTPVTNGSVFCRPNFESHVFFDSQWSIRATTGPVAPTDPITLSIQTWLNGYHILISPSGFANDWTVTLPAVGANQTWEFTQSFRGGIFNLELRKAPDFHLVQFMYQVATIPAGWSQLQIKPRLTLVHSIPSSQITFTSI